MLPREHARQGPNVIYTREVAGRDGEPVFVEDIDGAEYRVLDPSRLNMRGRHDDDTDSIRRHEYERGSDAGRVEGRMKASVREMIDDMPRSRDQMFIRDGNAEILRLVTRGRIEEEEGPGLNQPDRPYTVVKDSKNEDDGKDIIMKRFMEDQQRRDDDSIQQAGRAEASENHEKKQLKDGDEEDDEDTRDSELIKRLMEYKPDVETLSQDVNRLTVLQRDLLLTRFLVEEQRRFLGHHTSSVDETQSLPGVMTSMGTQTDRDRGTQTEEGLYTMRPPRRKAKSDNDESISDSELEERNAERRKKSFRRNARKLRFVHRRQNMDNFDELLKRGEKRCEIKTPILEETESAVEAATAVAAAATRNEKPNFAATKSSLLRKQSTRIKLYMLRTAGGRAVEEGTVPDSTETYNVIVNKESSTDESEEKYDSKEPYVEAETREGRHHMSFQSTSHTVDAMTNLAHTTQRPHEPQQYSQQHFPSMHSTAQAIGSFKGGLHAEGNQIVNVQNIENIRHSPSFHTATQAVGSAMGMAGEFQHSQNRAAEELGKSHSPSFYQTSQAVGSVFGFSGEVQVMEPEKGHMPSFHTTSQVVGTVVTGVRSEQETDDYQQLGSGSHPSIHTIASVSRMTPKLCTPEEQNEHVVPSVDPALLNTSDLSESGMETAKSEPTSSTSVKSMMGALKGFAKFGKARKNKQKSSSESHLPTLSSTTQTLDAAKMLSGKAKAKSLQSTPVAKKRRFVGIASLSRLLTPSKPKPHSCVDTSAKSKGSQGSTKSKTSIEKTSLDKKSKQESGTKVDADSKEIDRKELQKASVMKTLELLQKPKKDEKKVPRYMEWYKKKKEDRERKKTEEKEEKEKVNAVKLIHSMRKPAAAMRKDKDRQAFEDDLDSGIAMSLMMPPSQNLRRRNQNLLEKKSVFTIAYDEMQTRTLSAENTTPP